MKLVIAEKPSVAQSLAAVIGATARKDGYLEGNGWRVSWCVGHLAGLADADVYNPDYAKWRYDDLPILPEHWQMVVGKDKKKQFAVLKQLMRFRHRAQQAQGYKFQNHPFTHRQAGQVGVLEIAGGDHCMVVGHFFVVDDRTGITGNGDPFAKRHGIGNQIDQHRQDIKIFYRFVGVV